MSVVRLFWLFRDRQRNLWFQSRISSKNNCSLQTHNHHCSLFCGFLGNSLRYQHRPSIPLPSNNVQSDRLRTWAETSYQTCRGEVHTAAPQPQRSPSCCGQTASSVCWWCLCPGPVCRYLMERTVKLIADSPGESDFKLLTSETCLHFVRPARKYLTPPGSNLKVQLLSLLSQSFLSAG